MFTEYRELMTNLIEEESRRLNTQSPPELAVLKSKLPVYLDNGKTFVPDVDPAYCISRASRIISNVAPRYNGHLKKWSLTAPGSHIDPADRIGPFSSFEVAARIRDAVLGKP